MTKNSKFQEMLPPEIRNKIMYFAFVGRNLSGSTASSGTATGTVTATVRRVRFHPRLSQRRRPALRRRPSQPESHSADTDTLNNCRKVCKDWNEMIKRSIWQKPTKEWGIITKCMIEKSWVPGSFPSDKMILHAKALEAEGILPTGVMESLAERVRGQIIKYPSLAEVKCGASLAHQGLLGSVEILWLDNVNLASVPDQHLDYLISCVTGTLVIQNISGCDLVTALNIGKSRALDIKYQRLGRDETQALVRALETRVKDLHLEGVTLNITALTKYSGRGRCRLVSCVNSDIVKHRKKLKTWAERKHWEFCEASGPICYMKRPS